MIETIAKVLKTQILVKAKSGYYKLWCVPSINIATAGEKKFLTNNGEKILDWPVYGAEFENLKYFYFKKKAAIRSANCVLFIIENGEIVEIKEYWDEQIIIDFNNNLPKSKRGKIRAWYDNEEVWEAYLQKQAEKKNNT